MSSGIVTLDMKGSLVCKSKSISYSDSGKSDISGLVIENIKNSRLNIGNITGFNTGMRVFGHGGGCAYNIFWLTAIRNCNIGLLITQPFVFHNASLISVIDCRTEGGVVGAKLSGRTNRVTLTNSLSFNGNKMITTSGGGAVICPNAEAWERVTWYATQAREAYPYYQHEAIGFNYRLSNICAGIGRGQMRSSGSGARRRHTRSLWLSS